jgi:group I intron endonuclease
MKSGIYQIVNLKSTKRYVGSSNNIRVRWQQHRNDLSKKKHSNRHLQYAWDKYGEDSFSFEVMDRCPVEKLSEVEQTYIDEALKLGWEMYYNISKDTKCFARGLCDPKSPEHCKAISEGRTGMSFEDDHCENLSKAQERYLENNSHQRTGTKHSEESKRLQSAKRLLYYANLDAYWKGKKRRPETTMKAAESRSPLTREEVLALHRVYDGKVSFAELARKVELPDYLVRKALKGEGLFYRHMKEIFEKETK